MFVGSIFVYSYCIPLMFIIFFYSKIVGKVREHENQLRAQAKKMNVTSLRSNVDANEQSAEIRIAKVGITLTVLFLISWTPYAFMALTACFGNRFIVCS